MPPPFTKQFKLSEAQTLHSAQPGPQEEFLKCSADIAIFGGAAGGGKTAAHILDFLRHYNNPEARGIFFRRTMPEILKAGAVWDNTFEFYAPLNGVPTGTTWRFPSGSKLEFSHLEHEKTIYNYQGAEIPVIYFDELTHFSEKMFWYLQSRNRSTSGIKAYTRATTNPKADSWVAKLVEWWIDGDGFAIPDRSGEIRSVSDTHLTLPTTPYV